MKTADNNRSTGNGTPRGSRRFFLRLWRFAAALALIVASFEIAGLIYCTVLFDIDYAAADDEKRRIYDLLPSLQISDRQHLEELRAREPSVTLHRAHELHPYFAYVFEPDGQTTNNFGFPSSVDFPYRAREDELVVGLFGGSVAQQLGEDPHSRGILERRIVEFAKPYGIRSAKLLQFSLSGWKQPQTFFAFSYFFQHLDMAIFLDGANEAARRQKFPAVGLYRHLVAQRLSPQAQVAIGEIVIFSRALERWTRFCSKPILARSLFVHAIWRARTYRGLDEIRKLRGQLENDTPSFNYEGYLAATTEHSDNEYFEFFEQLSRWQALLSKDSGKPYYQFLQPQKLVRDSKRLSAAEEAALKAQPDHRKLIEDSTRHFRQLESMLERLRAEGFEAHSMVEMFRDVPETVYYDNVHLNKPGREMMAQRMADIIQASFAAQFGRGRGAASRQSIRSSGKADQAEVRADESG